MDYATQQRLAAFGIPTRNMTKKARKGGVGLQALARGSLALARTHACDVLTSIEKELEKELERDQAAPPRASVGKLRRKGERFLHSKHVLLIIVALNVIDCILVLGELILDIHYIVDLLDTSDKTSAGFLNDMQSKYHDSMPVEVHDISSLYEAILQSQVIWTKGNSTTFNATIGKHTFVDAIYKRSVDSGYIVTHSANNISDTSTSTGHRNEVQVDTRDSHGHSVEEDIAHAFHKASITILAILVVETLVKIFCEGTNILHRKIEIFDGIIVIASFILDLVFIKGLTTYPIQHYVFILAFLVPWRVIRVVNSLIVAVMDHATFRLKLLYSQKKQISQQLKHAKNDINGLKNNIEFLKNLGRKAGIPELKMERYLVRDLSFENSVLSLAKLSFENSNETLHGKKNGVASHNHSLIDATNTINEDDEFTDLVKQDYARS